MQKLVSVIFFFLTFICGYLVYVVASVPSPLAEFPGFNVVLLTINCCLVACKFAGVKLGMFGRPVFLWGLLFVNLISVFFMGFGLAFEI